RARAASRRSADPTHIESRGHEREPTAPTSRQESGHSQFCAPRRICATQTVPRNACAIEGLQYRQVVRGFKPGHVAKSWLLKLQILSPEIGSTRGRNPQPAAATAPRGHTQQCEVRPDQCERRRLGRRLERARIARTARIERWPQACE